MTTPRWEPPPARETAAGVTAALCCAFVLSLCTWQTAAAQQEGGANAGAGAAAATGNASPSGLAAKDVGVRYGQALGVIEVCYGSRLTDKAKSLEQSYQGADLEAFKSAAAGVYQAWVKVRGCTNQRDPNTCKIIMDRSCLAAQAEIGPSGSAVPGLVEFYKVR